MAKTAKEIEGDVFQLLRNTTFLWGATTKTMQGVISGKVYRFGSRPRDSKLEDAVVKFTAGRTDQIQTGVVTINLYVPDIDPFLNGVLVEDQKRCSELEAAAEKWVQQLTAARTDYLFSCPSTIQTIAAEEINQHFVVIALNYRLLTV